MRSISSAEIALGNTECRQVRTEGRGATDQSDEIEIHSLMRP